MKRSYKTILKIFFGFEVLLHLVVGIAFLVVTMILRVDLSDKVITASQFNMFSTMQIIMIIYFLAQIVLFIIFYNINNKAKVLDKPVIDQKPVEKIEE